MSVMKFSGACAAEGASHQPKCRHPDDRKERAQRAPLEMIQKACLVNMHTRNDRTQSPWMIVDECIVRTTFAHVPPTWQELENILRDILGQFLHCPEFNWRYHCMTHITPMQFKIFHVPFKTRPQICLHKQNEFPHHGHVENTYLPAGHALTNISLTRIATSFVYKPSHKHGICATIILNTMWQHGSDNIANITYILLIVHSQICHTIQYQAWYSCDDLA